jgi:hypothetical protein
VTVSAAPTRSDAAPGNGPMAAMPKVGPRRRRNPALASLGVVLVVVGALGGWRYVVAAGPQTASYLAVYQRVPVGAKITMDDLQTVSITSAHGLTPIPASEMDRVVGEYAQVELVPGTLLTDAEIATKNVVSPGQALIGLELSSSQRPGRALKAGDKILLVSVPSTGGADDTGTVAKMPTTPATVVGVTTPDNDDNSVVDVTVPVTDASIVAVYADQNRIAAVLVAGD